MSRRSVRQIYLDHAATTPVDPAVREAMEPFLTTRYGNPSSLHHWGREARLAIDEARERLGFALGCDPAEVCFTSSGTEADNLALIGSALGAPFSKRHLLVSAIEHHAVLQAAELLQSLGFLVEPIPVNSEGWVEPEQVARLIRDKTLFVSVMHANNEIGTLQPVREIAYLCRERGVLFHTDAVQTFGSLPVKVEEIGCDLLTVSAHKMYGPKGVGALYVRGGTRLKPLMVGGGQERERRAGTENVAGIIGFAKTVQLTESLRETESARLIQLRDAFIRTVRERIPDAHLNGHPTDRLPGNAHFRFEGVAADSLLIALDRAGIAASSGAACSAGSLEPSHVLLALGLSEAEAQTGVRFTLGRSTTWNDLEETVGVLEEQVARIRERKETAIR